MNKVDVKILADNEEFIPKYQTEGAACADLVCNLNVEFKLKGLNKKGNMNK